MSLKQDIGPPCSTKAGKTANLFKLVSDILIVDVKKIWLLNLVCVKFCGCVSTSDCLSSEQIRELVPESQAYMDLLAFERKLDQTIMRKRVDIQEALKRPMKVRTRKRD